MFILGKKTVASILTVFTILVSASTAKAIDISTMSTDELIAIRDEIDAELTNRKDADVLILNTVTYEVGVDIPAGTYYIAAEKEEKGTIYVKIYDKKESFYPRSEYELYAVSPPEKIVLQEGDIFQTYWGNLRVKKTPFSSDELAVYEEADGDYVAPGVYIIGRDMPAGNYTLYAADNVRGVIMIFNSETAYEKYNETGIVDIQVVVPGQPKEVRLNNGNVFKPLNPVLTKFE